MRIVNRVRSGLVVEDGFTIIEVMVAMTVFAMIAAGVAAGIVSSVYLTQDNRSREAALNLASQEVDLVRSAKDIFTVTNTSTVQVVAGQDYSVRRTTNWITSTGTDTVCGAGDGTLSYKRVNVDVSWTNGTSSSPRSVTMDTLIAPPSSVSSSTSSTMVIAVQTADGSPNAGVSVSVTPASNGGALAAQPAPTDANGCTYALDVKPGGYTVGITKSGYTDPKLNANPTYPVTTTAGSVGSQSMVFDKPAVLNFQLAANARAGSNPRLPSGSSVSLLNGDAVTPVTGTSTRVFPSGYSAVAGVFDKTTCLNVNPLQWTTPTANGLMVDARSVPTGVGGIGGATETVKVPMGVVDAKLQGTDTVLVAKATAGAKGVNDPGCTTTPGTTYVFTGLTAASATTIALPYGTYAFSEGTSATAIGANTPVFAASPGATNVNVTPTGRTVLFDPRTTAAP